MIGRLTTTVFFLLATLQLYGQSEATLRGIVMDSVTREPLPFANVFVNNTTIGTSTDLDGKFVLRHLPEGQSSIVFSYVGFHSRVIRFNLKEGSDVNIGRITLLQKKEELEEIQVSGKRDKDWEKRFKNFQRFLLGEGKAKSCRIQNPWAINFSENSTKTSIEATANEPIEIFNYDLGYKVYFHMVHFSANPSNYSIYGQFRFVEAEPLDANQAADWKQNRIDTYHGSERHLLKSILENRVAEEGFRLYTEIPGPNAHTRTDIFNAEIGRTVKEFDLRNAVVRGGFPDQYFIILPPRLEVHYVNKYATKKYYRDIPFQVSWIEIEGGHIEVNSDGIALNSIDVTTAGAMSGQRVADLLPLNYKPYTEVGNVKIFSVARLTGWSKYRRRQEFTYVHTDKPYYRPGERIWLKAYMRYRDPELTDSLSKVLYVELIDPKKNLMERQTLRIEHGGAEGHLDLPDTVEKGNYSLRAYTQWMRNYGADDFFVRPVPIIGRLENVIDRLVEYDTASVMVSIDARGIQGGDSAMLAITLIDQQGEPVAANISVSITDTGLVSAIARAPTILDFSVPDDRNSNRSFTVKYPVETGIGITGTVKDRKGRPKRASVLIRQRELTTVIPVSANGKGQFAVNGLDFDGRRDFDFQAVSTKGKPYTEISIDPKSYPDIDFEPTELFFEVEKADVCEPFPNSPDLASGAPGASPIASTQSFVAALGGSSSIYGKPDYVLDGSELPESLNGPSLFRALQGKIPGLRVTFGWDENNQNTFRVRLRGNSPMGNGYTNLEPILVIDGVPFNNLSNITIANSMLNTTIRAVERVEVIIGSVSTFGLRGSNGAILVYTRDGNAGAYQSASDDATHIPIIGYQQPEPFAVGCESAGTIFWKPTLIVPEEGYAELTFDAIDPAKELRIRVEGIDTFGRVVMGDKKIKLSPR